MLPSIFKFDTLVVLEPLRPTHSYASDPMGSRVVGRVVQVVEQTVSRTGLQPTISRGGFYLRGYAQKQTKG